MIPNIMIEDQTLDYMTQQILAPLDQALEKSISQTSSLCVQSARKFLNSIQQAYRDLVAANIIAKHQNKLKKLIKNPDTTSPSLEDQYYRNKNILKEMYQKTQIVDINLKMENFSKELNNFLNQKMVLTYVYTNKKGGNPIILLVDDISEIMRKDMASKGAGIKTRINMTQRQVRQALKEANSAINRLAQQDFMTPEQISNLKNSYNEVVDRFNKHKYIAKNGQNKSKTIHIILWIPQADWKIVVMGNNIGDIKQAYVNAVVNRKGFLSAELEKNIDDFMGYVGQVDATPGMLQGDVSEVLQDGSTIEYAVKGKGASFMSLQLAIDLAIEILTSSPPFDIQKLRQKKQDFAKNIKPRNQQITKEELIEIFNNELPDSLNFLI